LELRKLLGVRYSVEKYAPLLNTLATKGPIPPPTGMLTVNVNPWPGTIEVPKVVKMTLGGELNAILELMMELTNMAFVAESVIMTLALMVL